MAAGQEMEISEGQIAVHWREEDYYPAPAKFIDRQTPPTPPSSNGSARRTSPSASRNTPTCWTGTPTGTRRWTPATHRSVVRRRPPERLLQLRRPAPATSRNRLLDLGARAEGEDTTAITYQELRGVNEFAALLQGFGKTATA